MGGAQEGWRARDGWSAGTGKPGRVRRRGGAAQQQYRYHKNMSTLGRWEFALCVVRENNCSCPQHEHSSRAGAGHPSRTQARGIQRPQAAHLLGCPLPLYEVHGGGHVAAAEAQPAAALLQPVAHGLAGGWGRREGKRRGGEQGWREALGMGAAALVPVRQSLVRLLLLKW